jgi:chemotaxis protein MotB
MADHHPEIIIIKRHGGHEDGHHGGAWKIAFADFMTAMMAFFLVLWIINATDKDTKTVIARYFNPVKLENPARATKGVHGVDSMAQSQTDEVSGKEEPGAPVEPKHAAAQDGKSGGPVTGDPATPKKEEKPKKAALPPAPAPAKDPAEPAAVKATMSESELFNDPVKSLDKIAAGKSGPSQGADSDGGASDSSRQPNAAPIDSFRDPFKPTGPGPTDDRLALDADAPAAAPAETDPQKGGGGKPAGGDKPPAPDAGPAAEAVKPEAVKAGAADTAHQASAPARPAPAAAQLLKELEDKLGALGKSSSSPSIDVQATDDGLLISLTDRMNFSMFAIGSPEPNPAVIQVMDTIAKALKDRPGPIVLRGHTDGRAYKLGSYDNWRLSSARAQMAYYMLTRAGVPAARFDRVEGHADRSLRDPAHPLAAENRRIEILLRTPKS